MRHGSQCLVSTLLVALFLLADPGKAESQSYPITGMVDLHVHAAPDSRAPRSINVLDAARFAQNRGMRALLIKNHYTETASQAYLVEEEVPGIEIYGGIVLNRTVGGLNPTAVENMARITGGHGKVVWLPTFDSQHNAADTDNVPIALGGVLLPETIRVLEMVAEHELALATGHSSPDEVLLVIREAKAIGIDRIVVTHPSSALVGMSIEQQSEAAGLGALLEYTMMTVVGSEPINGFAEQIQAVGPENVVLTTDLGQADNPIHVDGMDSVLPRLEAFGFSRDEIDIMTKRNPARLLGLD